MVNFIERMGYAIVALKMAELLETLLMHELYIWCYNMLKVGSGSIQGDATFLEVLDSMSSMSCFVGIVNQVAGSKEYFATETAPHTTVCGR